MSEELLINVSPMESRVAVMNNGVLSEIYIERHNKMGLVGNIYIGTVVRVLPGMQAAFIDIGQSRTAFLHVNDMQKLDKKPATPQKHLQEIREIEKNKSFEYQNISERNFTQLSDLSNKTFFQIQSPVSIHPYNHLYVQGLSTDISYQTGLIKENVINPETPLKTISDLSVVHDNNKVQHGIAVMQNKNELENNSLVDKKIEVKELIQNRLKEGQRILVQVTKDQLGTKGARLTTNISLPSRYLVYIPSSDHIGISQRIDDEVERKRLRYNLAELMQHANLHGGMIARTAAEHITLDKLEEDVYYLLQLWKTIQARQQQANQKMSSVLVYQELSLPLRSIRDLVNEKTQRVVVDDAYMYEHLKQFAQEFVPIIYPHIVAHKSEQALFDIHRVEEDLQNALKRRVDLKSGGYLIIDQTEAMTTIDVNTGSYVGGRSLEDTVYKTNLEATHAIAKQLKLRNLGGIVILDFIDMQEQQHKDDVLISLQIQLAQDYAKTNITQVSELGLVEMTRKRTRESLEQQLCEPCPTCSGKGFIKTAETVSFEIFREIMRCARTYNSPKQFKVVAHSAVIDNLLTSEANTVADLEYLLGRVITFEVEKLYTQEQYDIVLD